MDDLARVFQSMVNQARQNCPIEDGDYEQDGLRYCGKCHTAKECIVKSPFGDGKAILPVMCQCSQEEFAKREEHQRKVDEMAEMRSMHSSSLMDEKFRDARFDNFNVTPENERNFRACRKYAEKFTDMKRDNTGLLLYGNVGTGKTYAAACIANYLLDRMNPVIMTSFVKILQCVQGFGDAETEMIASMNRTSLLIIDDLGAERGTSYALEKVYNVIDSRYRAKKPMILTTNLALSTMQDNPDPQYSRIYDRVFEVCYPLEFKGRAWRKKEAARRFDEMAKYLEGD